MVFQSQVFCTMHRQLNPRFAWQRQLMTPSALQAISRPPLSSPSQKYQGKSYYVPRNGRGNLPVYSDIKNAGGRHLVHIRNVEGNIASLVTDLSESLFPKTSPEAAKMKIQVNFGKHLVISGGRWKNGIADWLKTKGF